MGGSVPRVAVLNEINWEQTEPAMVPAGSNPERQRLGVFYFYKP